MARRLPPTVMERNNNDTHPQKGKSKTEATSYRPISLTSCVVKLLERIINARMKWYLESEQLLTLQQAGFREHPCTEDQTPYIAQEIEDGF